MPMDYWKEHSFTVLWLTLLSSAQKLGHLKHRWLRSKPSMGWNMAKEAESLFQVQTQRQNLGLLGSVPGELPGLRSVFGQNLTFNPFKSFVSPCCLNSGEKPWVTPLDPVQPTGMAGWMYLTSKKPGWFIPWVASGCSRDPSVIGAKPREEDTFLHLQGTLSMTRR